MKDHPYARKPLSKRLRFDIFERDKFCCQYCGRMPPDVMLEVDHIIPVSKGGTNDSENMRTSCCDCNRGKATKIIGEVLSPVDSARRSQEALETVNTAKMFAKASEARRKMRKQISERICEITGKTACFEANITSTALALEAFGFEQTFHFLDMASCVIGRGSKPNEDSLFRYFNGCVKKQVEKVRNEKQYTADKETVGEQ